MGLGPARHTSPASGCDFTSPVRYCETDAPQRWAARDDGPSGSEGCPTDSRILLPDDIEATRADSLVGVLSLPSATSRRRQRPSLWYESPVVSMKLEFSAKFEGLAFPEGEVLHVSVATEVSTLSTVMSTPERGVPYIVVSVDAASGIDDATIAERRLQVVSELIDRLAVRCDVGIGSVEAKPTHTPPSPPPSRSTSTTVVRDGDLVIVRAGVTLRAEVGPPTRAELRRVLVFGDGRGADTARQVAEPLPCDPLLHSMYREVLRGRDVLVRFVMLYAVLDAVVGTDGARGKGGLRKSVDSGFAASSGTCQRA